MAACRSPLPAHGAARSCQCALHSRVAAELVLNALRQAADISRASPRSIVIADFHVRRTSNNPKIKHQLYFPPVAGMVASESA
eukprot:611999-Pyramimonas_sp.AAC.1